MAIVKISLITVCYNAAATIEECILSVLNQSYQNIEYIIIDGASTDDTPSILNKHQRQVSQIISEPDNGLYDAMNKGINLATGDIIGILNADDFFADNEVLIAIAEKFNSTEAPIVYGDIDMLNNKLQIVRKWRSGEYNYKKLTQGWMPPHPAFYAKRNLFERFGGYNLNYGTAADYELMLRMLYKHRINAVYLNKVIVKMRLGGASNGSFSKRLNAWRNDYKAMKKHGLPRPVLSLLLKPLLKIKQYLTKL